MFGYRYLRTNQENIKIQGGSPSTIWFLRVLKERKKWMLENVPAFRTKNSVHCQNMDIILPFYKESCLWICNLKHLWLFSSDFPNAFQIINIFCKKFNACIWSTDYICCCLTLYLLLPYIISATALHYTENLSWKLIIFIWKSSLSYQLLRHSSFRAP
jgi:hypothetical protein